MGRAGRRRQRHYRHNGRLNREAHRALAVSWKVDAYMPAAIVAGLEKYQSRTSKARRQMRRLLGHTFIAKMPDLFPG